MSLRYLDRNFFLKEYLRENLILEAKVQKIFAFGY